MMSNFVTTTGIVTIKNNVVHIRKRNNDSKYKIILPYLVPLIFLAGFFYRLNEDESARRSMGLLVYGLGAFISLASLVYKLFEQRFNTRIPISEIQYYQIEEEANSGEIRLILFLKSGGDQILSFCKSENDVKAFEKALASFQIEKETSIA